MSPEDCPFCEIVERDEAAREVYRDSDIIAFFPTEPAVLGHILVVPRMHVPHIWSLDDSLAARLGVTTKNIARVMHDCLQPDGMNIIQSNGAAATQTVMHLHIHVVPRWHDDRMGRIWPPESNYSDAEKDDVWQELRTALRALNRDTTSI